MKKILVILASAALFGACKKNSSNNTGTNGAAILTSGSWKMTSSSSVVEWPAPMGTQTSDLFAMLPACQQDNLYKFNSDGSGTTDEGPTKCDPSDPQTTTNGSWSLTNNDKTLTVSEGGMTIPATVLTLDNSTLKIEYVTNVNNIKATTTTSYAHMP